MRNTGWTPSADDATRIALPHDGDGGTLEPAISDPWSAADNLYTTIHDYATFMLAVMHGKGVDPAIASDRFRVRDNAIEWMGCPLPAAQCPLEVGFGLGWEVFVYESETIVQHAGSDRGERTLGFFVPGTGKGVIIFTNGANGAKVIRDIVSLLHDNSGFQAFLNMQAGR